VVAGSQSTLLRAGPDEARRAHCSSAEECDGFGSRGIAYPQEASMPSRTLSRP
jgi:hypothetical protein